MIHPELKNNVRTFFRQLGNGFVSNNCQKTAAALTLTTLFAIVPGFTVIAWVMSLVPEAEKYTASIQDFIFQHFVPESAAEIQIYITEFSRRALGLKLTSLIMLVATAFVLLLTIESTINRIWQVAQPNVGLSRFLKYWGALTVAPPLAMVGIVAAGYLWSLPLISEIERSWGFLETTALWLPEFAAIGAFTFVFYVVPNTDVSLKNAAIGGIITTILFLISKRIFGAVTEIISTEAIYGTFAAVPFFLIWVYVFWLIVLAGSVFVKVLTLPQSRGEQVDEPIIMGSIRVLATLREAHIEGRRLSKAELWFGVAEANGYREIIERVLIDEGLLECTSDNRWVLGRNLEQITLWYLYSQFKESITVEGFSVDSSKDDKLSSIAERFSDFRSYGFKCLDVNLDEILS